MPMRLRRVGAAIIAVMVSCFVFAGHARPDPLWLGGEGPPFAFVADGTGAVHAGDTMTVVVAVGGRYYSGDAVASIHLTLPRALVLVAGETVKTGPLRAITGNYTLRLLTRNPGEFEVTGRFHVDDGEQQDDGAFVMPVTVRADTVFAEHSRYTLLESRRRGQRFRYGDWWLVPLDSTEPPVVEHALELHGARARVTHLASSSCRGCTAATGVDSVWFVVIVGPNGKVRDSRVMGDQRKLAPAVVAAAKEALQSSRFRAAAVNHSPVSDWLYVAVPVRRAP
jgi:hypothetical protein